MARRKEDAGGFQCGVAFVSIVARLPRCRETEGWGWQAISLFVGGEKKILFDT